jgi:hypothetical protein
MLNLMRMIVCPLIEVTLANPNIVADRDRETVQAIFLVGIGRLKGGPQDVAQRFPG